MMSDGISDDPQARELAEALLTAPAAVRFAVALQQSKAHLDDDAVIAAIFDDPAVVAVLINLSRSNELAMQAVRWALAYHVHRWHRLIHSTEPAPTVHPR